MKVKTTVLEVGYHTCKYFPNPTLGAEQTYETLDSYIDYHSGSQTRDDVKYVVVLEDSDEGLKMTTYTSDEIDVMLEERFNEPSDYSQHNTMNHIQQGIQ